MIPEIVKALLSVIGAIVLALFAKRYSDMKKRDAENKKREVENAKNTVIHSNNNTSLDDLVDRENDRARTRHDN